MSWVCPDCECENEAADQVCCACEAARPEEKSSEPSDDPYANLVVGKVLACEDAANGKLKKLSVDIGAAEPLEVVTNATNVKEGVRVVVACVGAVVGGVTIKRTQVQGIPSNGMLCDSVALGWTGGGAGTAATLPESFAVGSKPPPSRPRGDGK
jgi:tRNA-binding EMAP/Myf-like protein